MLTYLLVPLSLAVVVSSNTINVKSLQRSDEPEANGSFDFNYSNDKTEKAAETLLKFYTDAESDTSKFGTKLKTSNEATKLLKRYNDAVSSAGTSCKFAQENKNKFNGAQENIEDIVELCLRTIPKDDFDALKKAVKEDLAKIQAIDSTLRLNAQLCTSLRVPPSEACKNTEKLALDKLSSVLTEKELSRLTDLSEQASEGAEDSVEQCVQSSLQSLVDNLEESIKSVLDCRSD
ncbi:uncharacterized protein LOC128991706 [Macrosteles quadrilineatus]|uniref:uncharacterized protein LOC128991706 n=1 Tax=Macrosteles quadrilineatus TaxID=74068 RepID=UPI0023E17C0C|nr:uncharacterized protein LOC128991706 [Macrosteles quadrilineatus]